MRLAAVLLATACYQPTVATGVPCSSERDCPSGQVCAASDRCELPGRDATPSVDELPIDGPLGAFSAPQKLVELNSPELDTDPTISADGLEIVFSSSRPGGIGGTDLYRATRDAITDPFGQPQRIFELSTPDLDNASDLAGDGLTIYLRRIGPTATADVYRARRDARTLPFGFPVYEAALSSDL